MKNIGIYYVAILSPIPALVYLALINYNLAFTLCMLMYYFYRSVVDAERLIQLNVIQPNERWKMLNPLDKSRYFKVLYLSNKR